MIALDLSDFSSTIMSSCDNTPETYPSDPKPHYTRPPLALEVSPPPQPTLPKTNDIDLSIDMASILAKVNVPVPFSIDIVFFLNTYKTVAIATSWSATPIETTSKMIPLNVTLATSKMSVFPPPKVSLP
jgi:hypothetical protein